MGLLLFIKLIAVETNKINLVKSQSPASQEALKKNLLKRNDTK